MNSIQLAGWQIGPALLVLTLSACGNEETMHDATTLSLTHTTQGSLGTRIERPNVYEVRGGVDFSISNAGSRDYLFNWTDEGGNFVATRDPTLVLYVGEKYTFRRTSARHPLRITNEALPVIGRDGSFRRTTFDGSLLDAVTLLPVESFTADPAPTSDAIEWTPTKDEVGRYYYTCLVMSHGAMTGAIEVRDGDAQ
jgi:hypothetical protein